MNQKLLFVTGKGGVGKSTVAGALAWRLSASGNSVLLVEFSDSSYFSAALGQPISFKPTEVKKGLWVAAWRGEDCLKEFLLHYIRIQALVDLFFENKVMKSLVKAAPALKELALLGKATSGIRKIGPALDYDFVVIDAPASGHFEALIKVPQGMAEAIRMGPMGEQSRSIDKVLRDPKISQYFIVTLPEELPAAESLELEQIIKSYLGQSSSLICNRVVDLNGISFDEAGQGENQHQAFLDYVKSLSERQQKAFALLADFKPQFVLPMIYSSDSKQRIEILAEQMDDVVKSI